MIWVHVGIDHIADRNFRGGLHRRLEAFPLCLTAAGIDDGDTVVADDEPDVGNLSMILRIGQKVPALMDINALGDRLDGEGFGERIR